MTNTKHHILVPVDYSEKSIFGLEMADMLIAKYSGKITVINVIKGTDPIWTDMFDEQERTNYLNKLKTILKNFSLKYLANINNNNIDFIIEKGKFCDTIINYAENNDVTSIVMGTSTVDNIKKWIIGTNALRIVAESTVPVITVKQHIKNKPIERIILPLDLTKETKEKTVDAVSLALLFNAEIHVVSAQTIDNESIKKRLDNQLDLVIDYISKKNVTCTGRIIKVDDQLNGIMDFIKYKQGDLIIITTHQQATLTNSFMGSFAKGIIRKANIPVMSIVPKISHYVKFSIPGIR